MRKQLLNFYPINSRQTAEAILETFELFILRIEFTAAYMQTKCFRSCPYRIQGLAGPF